ncbi:MAG: carboxypeptidase regulatory-like domain-containing protein [Bryobacteraceae bacterium]
MTIRHFFLAAVAMVLVALLLAATAAAQVSNGRIEGVVTDPAGAVVPNATVTARNNRTGTVVTTTTNEIGYFLFASLPASNYTLTVEAPGFRKAQVENIELNVAVTLRQDVQLEVGSLAESVTVEASAIRVNTSDAQVGRSVTLRDIDTLPQLARNPMALVPYTPGVSIDPGDSSFSRINGTRQGSNNTRLDGIDANDAVVPRLGLSLTAFNVDSIEEFRVITNGGKAEYGRNAGGQIEMITRSGTNQWHGNAFEFLRNTKLNANNFFNNSSGVARPKFIQNTFGASLGGPILKEKWFIFGNWQSQRTAQEVVRNRTVLTNEAKRGLFRWRPPGSSTVQSFDIVANDPRALGFDPATKKLIDMLPEANNFDLGDGLNTAGFRFNNPAGSENDQFTIRTDYNLAATHRVFYRHSRFRTESIDALNSADATFPGQPQGTQGGIRWGFSAGSDWAITPTIVNELRVGYQSASVDFRRPARIAGPQVLTNSYTNPILPNFPQGRNSPVIDLTENLTWTKGAHTIKTGFTFKRTLQWGYNAAGIYPNISLSTANNNVPPLSIGPSGSIISSADRQRFENLYNDILGRVSNITTTFYSDLEKFQPAGEPRVRNTYFRDYAGFVQDDWKIARNLVLNIGVRYEVFGAPTERDRLQGTLKQIDQIGYFSQLDNTEIQRASGWYNTDLNNFAPRIGFSWDPTRSGKWAVRGSWGIFYDRMIGATASLVDGNTPGFAQTVQTFPNTASGSDVRVRDNPPLPAAPPAPQLMLPTNRQTSIVVFGPNLRTGYVQHYNLSIQREVMRNTILDVAYIRTRGIKLFNWVDVNQPRIYGNFLDSFKEIINFQRTGAAASPTNTLVRIFGTPQAVISRLGATTVQQQLANTAANNLDRNNYSLYAAAGIPQFYLRNFPQYNQVILGTQDGSSWYDSLQLSFRRTMGALKFELNYTFSKSLDNGSADGNGFTAPIDNYNMALNKGRGVADRPHVFNWSGTYTLPIGRGRRWLSDVHPVIDALFGGWDIGVLGVWQSGTVFSMSSGRLTGPSTANTYINYSGDRNIGSVMRRGDGVWYFTAEQIAALTDPAAFPGAGEIGTSGRNSFRGPRFFNFDTSIVKRFKLPWEQHRITFRWEMYNTFNNTNFGLPGATITTPQTVGRISGTVGNPRIIQAALRYDF